MTQNKENKKQYGEGTSPDQNFACLEKCLRGQSLNWPSETGDGKCIYCKINMKTIVILFKVIPNGYELFVVG